MRCDFSCINASRQACRKTLAKLQNQNPQRPPRTPHEVAASVMLAGVACCQLILASSMPPTMAPAIANPPEIKSVTEPKRFL